MTPGPTGPDADLSEELTRLGYLELFLRPDETAVDHVWQRSGAPEGLRRLALGPPSLPAFLAAEVLFARDGTFPATADRGTVAALYANALREDMTGMANPWGLPGELDGPVAMHVLALGDAAVPAFTALLTDETEVVYAGSEEATVGNSYAFRVKDVAASLLGALLGVPTAVPVDPHERDGEIDRLRQRLP